MDPLGYELTSISCKLNLQKTRQSLMKMTFIESPHSAFFELAELHALNQEHMHMEDWLPQVDDFAQRYGKGTLHNAGSISRQAAIEKATTEYKKYRRQIADLPSRTEEDYLENLKQAQKKLQKKTKISET